MFVHIFAMLPPEVINHIFGFLQSDPVTLKKCSKAHPILSTLALQHLYAKITIPNIHAKITQFSRLLSDNPCIANYVRWLCIEIGWQGYFGMRSRNVEAIALILPKFRVLKRLTLTSNNDAAYWPTLHETFLTAFMDCLLLPSMIEVSILGIDNFPLSIFANCTSIKKLTLEGTFDFDCSSSEKSLSYPQIESLTIHQCRASLAAITSWAKFCKPRSLGILLPRISDNAITPTFLQVLSNSLTSMNVVFNTACMFLHYHNFNHLPSIS